MSSSPSIVLIASASATTIDASIKDVNQALAVLLVFSVAFLTFAWSSAEELRGEPIPEVEADRKVLRSRISQRQRHLVVALALFALPLLATFPLVLDVLGEALRGGPYSALRATYVLVCAFQLMACLAAIVEIIRLKHRGRMI